VEDYHCHDPNPQSGTSERTLPVSFSMEMIEKL